MNGGSGNILGSPHESKSTSPTRASSLTTLAGIACNTGMKYKEERPFAEPKAAAQELLRIYRGFIAARKDDVGHTYTGTRTTSSFGAVAAPSTKCCWPRLRHRARKTSFERPWRLLEREGDLS
jgi:hypothetical protein